MNSGPLLAQVLTPRHEERGQVRFLSEVRTAVSPSGSSPRAGHGFPATSPAMTRLYSKEDVPAEDPGSPVGLKHEFLAFSSCMCSGV